MSKPIDMKILQTKLSSWMGDGGVAKEESNLSSGTSHDTVSTSEKVTVLETDLEKNTPINERILLDMFNDDVELFNEILNDFFEPSWQAIEEILTGFNKKSFSEVKMSSHKLKSAAFSVGAEELGTSCKDIEQAANEENWAIIDQKVPKITGVMTEIEQWQKKRH